MTWEYISGFFDADGSVTLTKVKQGNNKTIQISFHNNEESILKDIQKFILDDIGVKGFISMKKARKYNHSDSYDLKYTYQNGYKVICKLQSIHPKKVHRIETYKKIQECTLRNGKYTEEQLIKRKELEKEFFRE